MANAAVSAERKAAVSQDVNFFITFGVRLLHSMPLSFWSC